MNVCTTKGGSYGYGYGYILGPSPVPPIYLSGSFGLVRPACYGYGYGFKLGLHRSPTSLGVSASKCGGAHPTSPLKERG